MANTDPSEMIEEIRAWVDERFLSLRLGVEYQEIVEIADQLERLQIPVSEDIKSKRAALVERLQIPVSEDIKSKRAALESSLDALNEVESQLTFLVKELSSLAKDINHRLRDIRSQKTARGKKAPPKRLRVEFPDGTVVCENKATDTFVQVIQRIGLERVSELPLRLAGCPLVSARKYESARAVRELDGYFIATHSSTEGKATCIQQIADILQMDISVSVIDE